MPLRILVADDEELERRALARILSGEGLPELEILEASNGLEALAAVGEGSLAAAFLDIQMPGMDGIEAARLLREARPELPIVFLTAHDSFEYARSALRLRVEDFLLKPASAEEVKVALLRALDSTASESERDRGSRADATRLESAVAYMADELRAELAAGRVDGEGLARYAEIAGGAAIVSAVVAFRLVVEDQAERAQAPARPGSPGRLSAADALRAAASLAERRLGSGSRVALAGANGERILLAAASGGVEDAEAFRIELEALIGAARSELGVALVLGAALPAPSRCGFAAAADPPLPAAMALAQAALRALAVAGPARALVLLSLSSSAPASAGASAWAANGPAQRALELMETRFAEDLSLDGVAGELGVSPSHLSRLLGRQAGMGFADCLAGLRVERAKAFLASGRTSVKEASVMVGYRDPAYFARVFRRFCGMSPAEYRSGRGAPKGMA